MVLLVRRRVVAEATLAPSARKVERGVVSTRMVFFFEERVWCRPMAM